jgi:translation initiation factor 1A
MSLLNIMREQADEKLARTYYYYNSNYDYELELVKKLSLQEQNRNKNEELFQDHDEVKQYEEDELLALYLQREERSRVKRDGQIKDLKVLTPLEYKILYDQFGTQPEELENLPVKEEESEYNYVEPFQLEPDQSKREYPILYDPAQKKEDKEIGHVQKRMIEKRVNAVPVAMHHKQYATRNRGKVLYYGPNRERVTPKNYTFPIKNAEHDYGLVLKVLGGLNFRVFCYSNCSIKLCRMVGKLKHSQTYVERGSVVLYRIRAYQDKKADIVYKYSTEEYNQLLDDGELMEHDSLKNYLREYYHI